MTHPLDTLATKHRNASRNRTKGIWTTILDWAVLSRQRSRLASLDDHMLHDIGFTRHQAMTEAVRPFWDTPDHWHDRRRNS